MTYVNVVARAGYRRMASELAEAGIAGAILPDLPLDEAGPCGRRRRGRIECVLLAAPTTPDRASQRSARRARAPLRGRAPRGHRRAAELADSALVIARRCRALTDTPVLIGVGVSNPAQAVEACSAADGVVVGSALVRRLLEGEGPPGAAAFVASLRAALDAATD